jgi:hypothetical protein
MRDRASAGSRAGYGEVEREVAGMRSHQPARASSGVRTLMAAMLYDAICASLGGDRIAREDATAWIESRETDWIFSFVSVCDVLRLSPTAVRLALRRQGGRTAPDRRRCIRTNSQRGSGTAPASLHLVVPTALPTKFLDKAAADRPRGLSGRHSLVCRAPPRRHIQQASGWPPVCAAALSLAK